MSVEPASSAPGAAPGAARPGRPACAGVEAVAARRRGVGWARCRQASAPAPVLAARPHGGAVKLAQRAGRTCARPRPGWAVAGTAAQVARQFVGQLLARGPRAGALCARSCSTASWRCPACKTALRAVAVHQRLLHGCSWGCARAPPQPGAAGASAQVFHVNSACRPAWAETGCRR